MLNKKLEKYKIKLSFSNDLSKNEIYKNKIHYYQHLLNEQNGGYFWDIFSWFPDNNITTKKKEEIISKADDPDSVRKKIELSERINLLKELENLKEELKKKELLNKELRKKK